MFPSMPFLANSINCLPKYRAYQNYAQYKKYHAMNLPGIPGQKQVAGYVQN
jgi:hypothetical protein